jgi:hypothetical protein
MSKKIYIAKNGTPYVKDENGKVRFISIEEMDSIKDEKSKNEIEFPWVVKVTGFIIVITLTYTTWLNW